MSKYKCAICRQYIEPGEESIPYKNRFAHTTCFNELMKASSDQKRMAMTEKSLQRKGVKKKQDKEGNTVIQIKGVSKDKSAEEIADEKLFFEYIIRLTGHKPDVKTATLAKKYTTEYELKYIDLVTALKYIYEIEQREFDPEKIAIGLVPYKVEEAKRYYASLEETVKKNNETNTNSFYKNEIVNIKQIRKRVTETIDISEIREG